MDTVMTEAQRPRGRPTNADRLRRLGLSEEQVQMCEHLRKERNRKNARLKYKTKKMKPIQKGVDKT
jgi:hypothetical protein